jgi:arabinogalactan oligomer/maltooligosaccharide transport system substrate-binding protein
MSRLSWICALMVALLDFSRASAAELVLWEQEDKDTQEFLDGLFREFQAASPGTVVTRVHYGNEQLRDQFKTAAMGRGGADVLIAPSDFAGTFSIMGLIAPMERLGEAARLERFPANVLDAVRDASGRVWGLPLSKGNHLMLFANRRLIPVIPDTLEGVIDAARGVTKASDKRYGIVYNLTEPFWFASFLGAYGGALTRVSKGVVEPTLDTEAMRQALSLVHSLKFEHRVTPEDCDYTCAEGLFLESRAGFVINGDWAVPKYRATFGEDLLIAPLPRLASTNQPMRPFVSGKFLFFNANLEGDKLELAKRFAEWFLQPEVQERLLVKTRRLPSLTSLAESALVVKDPVLAATDRALANGLPMPMAVEMRAVWDAIRPQLQAVMAGRGAPAEAAAIMQRDALTKIREMKEAGEIPASVNSPSDDCLAGKAYPDEFATRARIALSVLLLLMVGFYYRIRRERDR